MEYPQRKIEFNPPRAGIDEAPSLYPTKESQARRKLSTINGMISRAQDPESRARLEMRRAELEKELQRCDTKRQAHARALWRGLMEKRTAKETR